MCRLWDIRSKECVVEFKGHADKVRAISTIREDYEFISGSYDHSAKVWDSRRNDKCVLTMDHGAQVESVVSVRGGFASAGGTCVNVWDEAGEIKSQTIGHKKHVTCLGVDGTGNRLISGSLDQFVKIYDLEQTEQNLHAEYTSLRIVASVEFGASVMSLAMSKDGRNFAIGMLDGVVDMRRIRDKQKKKVESEGSSASTKRPKSIVERGDGIEEDEDIDADEWMFSDDEETGDQEDDDKPDSSLEAALIGLLGGALAPKQAPQSTITVSNDQQPAPDGEPTNEELRTLWQK
jgi:WD40 repeat protein